MKTRSIVSLMCLFSVIPLSRLASAAETPDGTAIAIVYDTSGSMVNNVTNANGEQQPKFRIASLALTGILAKIDAYAKTHPVEAGLITFQPGESVAFGKWNKAGFESWLAHFNTPSGGTPLGEAIAKACNTVMASKLTHRHVVVLTDGESNGKMEPARAVHDSKRAGGETAPQIHIVAFDVNSRVFEPIKKEGATILPASGRTLEKGLQYLFSEKILLEDEE